ncbi:MAG: TatD family hydrolase [Patescibacteria group bacterium]|nr:TatD family hydrolase [Patescibacteria group bacterium]
MLIDTHAHVNFKSFKDDAKETLRRALDNDTWVINVGSQIDTSKQAVELANQFDKGVYAIVGLHPEHTHSQYVDEEETHFQSREENFDYNLYRELASNPKVVGIGECGLDYYRLPHEQVHENFHELIHEQIKEKQKSAFRQQVKLAMELNKVLVIHSRPAKGDESLYDDLLGILDEENNLSLTLPLEGEGSSAKILGIGAEPSPLLRGDAQRAERLRFEVHSYTGSSEYLQKFLDRGAYVSFNGIITFDKTGNMEKLVKMAPLDRILLETDCPYLTPAPNRGKRNEPLFVKFTAEKTAEIKNLSVKEIAEITTKNARQLFKI